METVSEMALCVLVLAAAIKVLANLLARIKRGSRCAEKSLHDNERRIRVICKTNAAFGSQPAPTRSWPTPGCPKGIEGVSPSEAFVAFGTVVPSVVTASAPFRNAGLSGRNRFPGCLGSGEQVCSNFKCLRIIKQACGHPIIGRGP